MEWFTSLRLSSRRKTILEGIFYVTWNHLVVKWNKEIIIIIIIIIIIFFFFFIINTIY